MKKKYRVRVEFSCYVEGENPRDAVANLMYGLSSVAWTDGVRNLVIKENGEFRPVPQQGDGVSGGVAAETPGVAPVLEPAAPAAPDSDFSF